ncbi:MAG: hypothetical protein KGM47_00515 [Acidobacteriota bacterium]|nr:hypothetical protein [Acidobacteriota bacterium]
MASIKRTVIRTAVAILFSAILLIPRLRRLRRSVPVWTAIRIVILALGVFILWRGWRSGAGGLGASYLTPGIILVLFAALVGARPVKKPVDAVARELEALIVLNGGSFLGREEGHDVRSSPGTSIFVSHDSLRILDRDHRHLLEIAVGDIRDIVVREEADGNRSGLWFLEIMRKTAGSSPACFRYDGVFAEHMARVAERTLLSVWKKGLPVIGP